MPDVLLNTADMMVSARVPPKGSATAISEMTVAMLLGKRPTACREPWRKDNRSAADPPVLWE